MTRTLRIQALAHRAFSLVGKTARQSAAAKQQRCDFYAAAWREAAGCLDADIHMLGDNVFTIFGHGRSTRVFLNYTELDGPVALRIAGNKPLVHRLLNEKGIPTPSFCEFTPGTIGKAVQFLDLEQHDRCVVKPAAGTGGGQGVTTGVTSARALRRATVRAAGYSERLVVERQIRGANVRLLFLDGELLDAVERCPPTVSGDGKSSVAQLVHQANSDRLRRGFTMAQSVLRIDQDMRQTLAAQNMTLRSVAARGTAVQLKTVINDNTADDNHSVMNKLHESVISTARAAADTVGLRLAGIDIVSPDLSLPLADVGGVVLEVNSTPGFHFHYAQRSSSSRIAIPILAACLNGSPDGVVWRHSQKLSTASDVCSTDSTVSASI